MSDTKDESMCSLHKADNDSYCTDCGKLICVYCKAEEHRDHFQIHIAGLASNIIIQMKSSLADVKGAIDKEYVEVYSMVKQFEEDKKHFSLMMQKVEQQVVQMLQLLSFKLCKTIQRNEEALLQLKANADEMKAKCQRTEQLLDELFAYNAEKKYWEIFSAQEKMKQVDSYFSNVNLKDEAVKESISRKSPAKLKVAEAASVVPARFLQRKEEVRKATAVPDSFYFKEIEKDIKSAMNAITRNLKIEIDKLRQWNNALIIKNNATSLISKQDRQWITSWLTSGKTDRQIELELLYKGTKDGFDAADFHARCNDKGPTLTLVLADGKLFGGYTVQPWAECSPGVFREDANAFTFSLTNKVKCKVQNSKKQAAVRHLQNAGPVFGMDEIYIADRANTSGKSHAKGGISYTLPQGVDGRTIYTQEEYFVVTEVEVYKVNGKHCFVRTYCAVCFLNYKGMLSITSLSFSELSQV
eukprot:TRINITY_DN2197_c0_g1_i2.p1 TRINITY_DN2197_c0_g1~~TRINITY_DN2197_c0_g1_i2.p1  ORF type:complete len:470 (-),score=147.80 TRINITY_DN2197_c0_g1_i2:150-1559(-)